MNMVSSNPRGGFVFPDGSEGKSSACARYTLEGGVTINLDALAHVGTVFNHASAKLGEFYRKLEEAQRIMHVGYWEWDLQTNRMIWSDELYRIFGMQPQERPMFGAPQEMIHPDNRGFVNQAVERALAGGARFDVEARIIRPKGEIRSVHGMADVKKTRQVAPS